MIGHSRYRTRLPWRHQLTLREEVDLTNHLNGCAECRSLDDLIAENRQRLRALRGLRPPEDLRRAVLQAAERSGDAGRTYAFLLLPLLLMPAILTTIILLFVYGLTAIVSLVVVLGCWAGATEFARSKRREAASADDRQSYKEGLRAMVNLIAADLAGTVAGTAVLLVLMVGMTLVLQVL
jgi:predicted anti-sigma-YlaC factor YlaD